MFERGETITIPAVITKAGTPTDPENLVVSIVDPLEVVLIDATDMVKDDVGEYYYNYTLLDSAALGMWKVRMEAGLAGRISIQDSEFYVIEGVL